MYTCTLPTVVLVSHCSSRFYTAADAEELVTYASHRGIRIIAEVG